MKTASLGREESVARNREELAQRRITLSAPPRLVTLGAHAGCNARCVFCPPESFPRFDLGRYQEFFEGRMGHFIRQAEKVTFTGYGEVLWSPDAVALLDYLNETIPETWKIFTTNGTPLSPAVIERLLRSKFVMQVSLHASRAELHEELTGLKGAFGAVVDAVRTICRLRRERDLGERLHLVLVDVVTTRNAGELADFVRLAWDLQAPEVQCNYVTVYEPAQIGLSCFFAPEKTNAAIEAAERALQDIKSQAAPEEFEHFQVRLPPKFGQPRVDRDPKAVCADPWEHIYVECQGPALPCCMWGEHIGNLQKGDDIDAVFNGPVYRAIREGMASGKPQPWCALCANYRGYNVNSLLCHLTNRPETQKRLIDEIRARGLA
ncbi:MAG TPA: hypothetical protein DD417_05825 [Elusimicrobia bacterium]|nr:hypothetical protein [Elusimicrobiota bacterium]